MTTSRAGALAALWRAPATLLVATVIAFFAIAAAARAYVLEGDRWPTQTITYYPSAYKKAADRAAQTWNNAQVGVTFKRVSSKSDANFVVVAGPEVHPCEGFSLVGYQGHHVQSWIRLGRPCNLDGGDDREFMIITATHEFGHILGLGHEKHKCARMNSSADFPSGTPGHCKFHSRSYWLKHLLRGDDINGARALYGG